MFCRVSGFDHSPLDEAQDNWNTHMFPYKLGTYQKTALSIPTCVYTIDYTIVNDQNSFIDTNTTIDFTRSGRCDCVAIWVDYDLTTHHTINFWENDNFPIYYKTNIRFFKESRAVEPLHNVIQCNTSFEYGNSDLDFVIDLN